MDQIYVPTDLDSVPYPKTLNSVCCSSPKTEIPKKSKVRSCYKNENWTNEAAEFPKI